jgi:P2-related tail formation protein
MHAYAWQISNQNARNNCRNQNAEIKLRRTGIKEAAIQQIEQIIDKVKASISNRNARIQSVEIEMQRSNFRVEEAIKRAAM